SLEDVYQRNASRAARTRCNGKTPCANCANRGCDCVYTASKRGGARRRKKNNNSEGHIEQSPPNELLTGPAPVVSLATPGAGLLQSDEQLDFDMDFDFDPNIQGSQEPLTMNEGFLPQNILEDSFRMETETPVVKTYANDEDINQAQVFAQLAIDGVEIENEMIESIVDPGEALSAQEMQIYRRQIHPQVRLEAESTIALLLLCTYEYSQRGNISKMRKRCGQALVSAMDLGLHSKDKEDYPYAESDRRVWWMTYVCVCQGSILSCMAPSILLCDPRFTTPLPTFGSDSDAWDVFLEAQRVIATATQFVIDLESSLKSESHDLKLWETMAGLERTIEPLVQNAEKWSYGNVDDMEPSESVVAKSLRMMTRIKLNSARIKIHRYCAFSDMPVFTKKHCDLSSTPSAGQNPGTACGCSNNLQQATATLALSPGILNSPIPDDISVFDSPILPFSGRFSSKVCMQSAFNIAQSFRALPLPRPSDPRNASYWNSTRQTNLPRMMPIFACCSMQASYSMIMLCHKTLAIKQASSFEDGLRRRTDKLLFQLHEGIRMILDALENYSTANEALKGMRDQIRMAVDSVAAVQ
ncbi:C6 zinc finger domain-containing protein, partial [Botrytis cinerea]